MQTAEHYGRKAAALERSAITPLFVPTAQADPVRGIDGMQASAVGELVGLRPPDVPVYGVAVIDNCDSVPDTNARRAQGRRPGRSIRPSRHAGHFRQQLTTAVIVDAADNTPRSARTGRRRPGVPPRQLTS